MEFAVWDGIFWVYFSVFREFDTVPKPILKLGWYGGRYGESIYTVPNEFFAIGTVCPTY